MVQPRLILRQVVGRLPRFLRGERPVTLHVLHLTQSVERGGRRDAILTLADHLGRLGVSRGLVALRNSEPEIAQVSPHFDHAHGLALTGRPGWPAVRRLKDLCLTHRVDLLHAHDGASQFVASMLRLVLPSRRVVMTFHRTLGTDSEGTRNRWRNRLTLPTVAKVLTASEERRRHFLAATGIAPDRVEVIPLGVDLRRFAADPVSRQGARAELGISEGETVFLAIGHAGEEKGIDRVIEGAARLGATVPAGWRLLVLGGGDPERAAWLRRLGAERLGDRVTFLGFRDDVPRWLHAADALVHLPRQEAFGLVVVQAMACRLPVVAVEVGGLPDIVVPEETGLLLADGSPDPVAGALARMLDPALRERFGAAGEERARGTFDAALSAARHLALYRRVLGRP